MRLDHLLSKEHTASIRITCIRLGSSHVDHWLFGVTVTSDPGCPRQLRLRSRAGSGTTGYPVHNGLHCSVLKERSPWVSLWQRGRVPPLSSAPGPRALQPRDKQCLGALLENCIVSTSVLVVCCISCSTSFRTCKSGSFTFCTCGTWEECAISSYKEPTVDALAPDADEGRGWLR